MGLIQKHSKSIKIFSFLLMIGLMIVLNNEQEDAKNRAGKTPAREIVYNANNSGITPGSANIPGKTEGALPLRLISKTNSNFLLVINNCQHVTHSVRYMFLQKRFLAISSKINFNFITEFLATIRNKDYR